jgi:xylan 1,4-beta-xylosidase
VSSAGHAKFVQTQNGQWWATFLATRPYQGDSYATGRETFLLPVKWRDNWPVILDPGVPVPLVTNRPQLADGAKWKLPGDGSFSYTEEFDGRTLGPQWIGIRTPKAPFYRLVDGALELGAGAALGDVSAAPAFIGRRLQHAEAQVSTRLRYQPEAEGARAGLAAVQSDRSLLFFGITQLAGKPVVALYTRDRADIDTLVSSAPVDATKPVELAIRITRGSWSFTYSQNGVKHLLKADVNAEFMTTQRAGGFVGTVIGAYSFK